MKKIYFIADGHSYWLDSSDHLSTHKIPKEPGLVIRLNSVGSFFGQFFPDFDRDYWLTYKALQKCDPDGFSVVKARYKQSKPSAAEFFPAVMSTIDVSDFFAIRKQLAEFWEFKRVNSAFLGSQFHSVLEKQAHDSGFMINCWTGERQNLVTWEKRFDNESYSENLMDLPDGSYSELLVFDLETGIAGQIDECFIKSKGKKRYFWINDHKTNEEKPGKSSPEKAFDPISHLNTSKHTKYSMQVSIYAWILKKAGFIPAEIGYTFYEKYDQKCYENVKVEPFFTEIEKMFQKIT